MKKKLLFVCIENSCRSQVAEGVARHYGKDIVDSYSAGSSPSGIVNPAAILVMQEIGIDISSHKSKGFSDLIDKHYDYVITMGCGETCPLVPSSETIDWKIPDPKGKPLEFFRKVRDIVKKEILELLEVIRQSN